MQFRPMYEDTQACSGAVDVSNTATDEWENCMLTQYAADFVVLGCMIG
jgi:hypothetical protein